MATRYLGPFWISISCLAVGNVVEGKSTSEEVGYAKIRVVDNPSYPRVAPSTPVEIRTTSRIMNASYELVILTTEFWNNDCKN